MHGDREGHGGFIANEGRTLLYQNGELVGEGERGDGGSFEVGPQAARYRLELELSQALFQLTTREKTVWTFESAHVAEGESARLPLLSVRFDPELNARGQAPRGQRFRLPLSVAQYGQRGPLHVSEPTVEVSYDDGASWDRVRVERDGERWAALLEHPRRGEYVSLCASARDRHGNGVEQTLIRAYRLTGHH